MTVTSVVLQGEEELQDDRIEIGAFAGNECRGSIRLKNFPEVAAHPYLGFLVVFGDQSEEIRLRVYDHETGREYETANASLSFASDASHGSPAEPYRVVIASSSGNSDALFDFVTVYLDPQGKRLNIRYPWERIDRLEMVDTNGRLLWQENGFASESVDVSWLEQGVYLLKIVKDNRLLVNKFVK